MNPDNPLQILKAVPRYAGAPFSRWSGRGMPRAFFFGPRERWGAVLEAYPGRRFVMRTLGVSAFEFQMSVAPWILSDRRSTVFIEGAPPQFLEQFCRRNGVPITQIDAPATTNETKASAKPPAGGEAKTNGAEPRIPAWFRRQPGTELSAALAKGRPTFLYMPWIPEHGDTLIGRIGADDYELAPFDLVKDVDDNDIRRAALRFARERPDLYRRMVVRRLVPLRDRINGFILTFDWAPVMRIIVEVCKDLGIPTILIPHESVFVDRNLYYTDITSKASLPLCDVILGWGEMQRSIFLERGYPEERFFSVGAPKFDIYHDYKPKLDRQSFYRLFGLSPDKKTILFASQPLDSQTDQRTARLAQRNAISDLLRYCEENDFQLIVRMPPSKEDILAKELTEKLTQNHLSVIDDAECYLVDAEEAIHHTDVVTSINSTMLFEAVLSDRPSVSMKYVEFDQIWTRAGIPAARNYGEAKTLLNAAISDGHNISAHQFSWAESQFGIGTFDGKASERIAEFLMSVANHTHEITTCNIIDDIFSGRPIDIVGIPSSETTLLSTQKHLTSLMKARTILDSGDGTGNIEFLSSVNVFLKWGIKDSNNKQRQQEVANALGKPVLVVEDGFIRSLRIGLSGDPGLAIILDDTTAYYDATTPSRLERQLESGPALTEPQRTRARAAIDKLVGARVSKYNHAPDRNIRVGSPERPKLLLVDQRFGDQSVISGLADESSFDRMILDALEQHPDHDIIVKQHPDAISGGKSSYFSNERLVRFTGIAKNIYPIAFDISPFALFDLVDDVYVATSGMGFEALMAGKRVHCYGAPFYSGWGITDDKIPLSRRTRRRSVEDVFFFSYIQNSRYFDPDKAAVTEVEDVIDYITKHRK